MFRSWVAGVIATLGGNSTFAPADNGLSLYRDMDAAQRILSNYGFQRHHGLYRKVIKKSMPWFIVLLIPMFLSEMVWTCHLHSFFRRHLLPRPETF